MTKGEESDPSRNGLFEPLPSGFHDALVYLERDIEMSRGVHEY